MGKAAAQKKLIENMADVFRKVQKEYGLPFGESAAPQPTQNKPQPTQSRTQVLADLLTFSLAGSLTL
jgi:hypothetical protein